MNYYRIKDWDKHFETADSRKRESLSWTAIPTKLTGGGYRRIVAHPRACEILAAFHAMVKIAANARKPRTGALVDGNGPLSADDLHFITGLPAAAFEIAFEVLVQPKIEWLEVVTGSAESAEGAAELAEVPAEPAEGSADGGRLPADTGTPRQNTSTTVTVTKTVTETTKKQTPRAKAEAAGIELPADPVEAVRVLLGAVMVGTHGFGWGNDTNAGGARATVANMLEQAGGNIDAVVLELHALYKLGPPGKSFKAATQISELIYWRDRRQEEAAKASKTGRKPETINRDDYATGRLR